MELLKSTLILVGLGLLWLIIVYFSFKRVAKDQKKKDSYMLFFGLAIFFILGAIFVLASGMVEIIESPEFCGNACHPMEPYYETYENPVNNTMMSTHVDKHYNCGACHNDPKITGSVKALTLTAMYDMYATASGNYEEGNLSSHLSEENCLKCHDGSVSELPGELTSGLNKHVDPHEHEEHCSECHNPHEPGNGLTTEACIVCHGTEVEDFEDRLHSHQVRAGEDCYSCHDIEHPTEKAVYGEIIPIAFDSTGLDVTIDNDFCSDCHEEQYTGLISTTAERPEYDDCFDCHNDHNSYVAQHDDLAPYDDCSNCHEKPKEEGGVHWLALVSFVNASNVRNEFCQECHEDEYELTETYNTEALCTDCHEEHDGGIAPHSTGSPYNDCENCHVNSVHDPETINFWTAEDIESEFCENCHEGQTETIQNGNHAGQDCADCHGNHGPGMDFDHCAFCHDVPDSHDSERTNCVTCHDLSKVHNGG